MHVSVGVQEVLVSSALLPQELQKQLGSCLCCAVLGKSIQSKPWSSRGDEFVVMVFSSPHMGESQVLTRFPVVGSLSLKDPLVFGEIYLTVLINLNPLLGKPQTDLCFSLEV